MRVRKDTETKFSADLQRISKKKEKCAKKNAWLRFKFSCVCVRPCVLLLLFFWIYYVQRDFTFCSFFFFENFVFFLCVKKKLILNEEMMIYNDMCACVYRSMYEYAISAMFFFSLSFNPICGGTQQKWMMRIKVFWRKLRSWLTYLVRLLKVFHLGWNFLVHKIDLVMQKFDNFRHDLIQCSYCMS